MATHPSILAWEIPQTEMGCSPWGHKESDMTEHTCIPYTPPPIYPGTGLTGAMGKLSQPRRALGPQQRATLGAENPTREGPQQPATAEPTCQARPGRQSIKSKRITPQLQAECCYNMMTCDLLPFPSFLFLLQNRNVYPLPMPPLCLKNT